MPPSKRKRPDRQVYEDDASKRPSPYRPERTPTNNASPTQPRAVQSSDSSGPSGSSVASMPVIPLRTAMDHITQDLVSTWNDGGSKSIVATATQADEDVLSEILQELTEICLRNHLRGEQAGTAVREIIKARRAIDDVDVTAHFLDTISLLDDDYQKNPALRALVSAAGIDLQTLRQELDIPLLQALGLVRDTFDKMRTRKTTNILYKQANFNLLREESEGYAKLVTEYYNTVQDACSRRDENPDIAEDAFQRVKALVGAFDLDVGRVLDITLDVSANLLVKAYPFLMKFYRASSWWPSEDTYENVAVDNQGFTSLPSWALPGSGRSSASEDEVARLDMLKEARDINFWNIVREKGMDAFFEIGSRQIVDYESALPLLNTEIEPELDSRGKETNPLRRQYLTERRRYMRDTRSLPPQGNYDAAQLLGFKLRFYASAARNASDILPDNLIKLAAFLIKIGFISLRDLYPHLHPADADMPQEKARLEKEKAASEAKNRPGAGVNALAMAGALTDDTLPAPRTTRTDKGSSGGATPGQEKSEPVEELPTPENQKLQLLKALLLIGALPEALHIIGRFPWLIEADATIPPLLHRIADHMLSKMTAETRPLAGLDGLRQTKDQVADLNARSDGRLAFTTRQTSRPMRWLHSDTHHPDDGVAYIHYYVDWNDNIPICQSLEDVLSLCDTFLGLLGLKIGQDVKLYGTLLRLAKADLTQDLSESNRNRWLDMMKRLLVPALSLSKHNPQLAQDVYDLLSFYPTSTRYAIYAEWFTGRTSRLPDIRAAFDRNKAEVRDVLRRVSNDSGKKQSRALAKVTLSSPGVVIMEMINQLESYSNMIPSLVECTRFFSPLAYDVLTWCLINSMGGQGRDRQQADGMLTSPWLQALSHFVASLFTKYANLDPTPVLQYLAFELRSGNATDLEMIEQILVEMAGIRSDVEFNDAQVLAMAGGEQLQGHIMRQLSDSRHTKEKSARRLIKALHEPRLVGQILVAIAQERQMYPDHDGSGDMPLKVLGNNLDKIQAIFAQYLEVLRTNLKPEQFELSVPDAVSLTGDFGIEPGVALVICRTVIRHKMSEFDAARKQEVLEEKKLKAAQAKKESSGDIIMQEVESKAEDAKVEVKEETKEEAKELSVAPEKSPWHPVLEPIIDDLGNALPELSGRVSLPFFVTFWTLMHQDLLVPTDSYKREIARIDSLINELSGNRVDMSAVAVKERDRKKKTLHDTRDKLSNETKPHLNAYMQVRSRISNGENHHWFPRFEAKDIKQEHAAKDARHLGLLQECFLPRAMLSALDAHYSFQMLKIMHDNGTPGFSLMHLLSQLFRKQLLSSIIFQYTAVEAQNFGRFICETMKLLHRWHADKAIYEKEALGLKKKLPGFVKTFDEKGEPKNVMDWEEFRRLLFNFHTFLYGALTACFESDEYMHVRNAIIVLKSVHVVFPILAFQGKNMIDVVKKFSEKDSRSDLKLAAMSLLGPLKSGEKNWLTPQKFRLNDPGKDGAKSAGRGGSAKLETPQSAGKLNAAANDFKPASVNRSEVIIGGPEDGEIEDEKSGATDGDVDLRNAADKAGAVIKQDARGKATPRDVDDVKSSRDMSRSQAGTPTGPGQKGRNASRTEVPRSTQAQGIPAKPPPPAYNQPSTRGERDASNNLPPPRFQQHNDEGYGRLDRPNDVRPLSRDPSPGHRNGRTRSPSHSTRGGIREERPSERPLTDSRGARDDARQSRRDLAADSRSSSHARDRQDAGRGLEPPAHPERANRIASSVILPPEPQMPSRPSTSSSGAQTPSDAAHNVNPARLALINADVQKAASPRHARDPSHTDNGARRERDLRADERPSIPNFPARPDARLNSRPAADSPRDQGGRQDPFSDQTPTGPKRGRSNRDLNANVESSYGRLNAPHAQDSPQMDSHRPDGSGGRGGRGSAPNHQDRPPSPPARLTESNSSARGELSRQPSLARIDRQAQNGSAPSTPGADMSASVHPSRLAQLGQPITVQTAFNAPNGPRGANSPLSSTPSGPRAAPRPPNTVAQVAPSPTTSNPPSGPARRNERPPRPNANQPPNATTNGNQGINFRGASARQANASGFSPSGSRPAGQNSSMDPPARHGTHNDRETMGGPPELFNNRSSDQREIDGMHPDRRRLDDDRSRGQFAGNDPSFRSQGNSNFHQPVPPQPNLDDNRARRNDPNRPPRDGPSHGGRREPNAPLDNQQRRQDFAGPPGPQRGGPPDDNRRNGGRMSGNFDGPGPRGQDFRGSGSHGPPGQQGGGNFDERGGPRGPMRGDMPSMHQPSPNMDNRKRGPQGPPFDSPGGVKRRRGG